MPVIQIQNRKVHYIEMNKEAADTIIMVHGLFSNLSVYYFHIGPRLSKHFHVVMFDLRSHGMSEWKENGYTLQSMSNDIIELADSLNIKKFDLFGYSFGGLVCLNTSINYPDRVKKIVLLDSPNPAKGRMNETLSEYRKEFVEQYMSEYTESNGIKPNRRQIEKSERLYNYMINNEQIREEIRKDSDFVRQEVLEQVNSRTLLLYAKGSECFEAGKEFNKLLRDSVLKVGYGDHNIPIQNPLWISATAKYFYQNNSWNTYADMVSLFYNKFYSLSKKIPYFKKYRQYI